MTAMPKSGGSNCRYEIRYTASETGKEHVFGWTDQAVTAEKMRSCLMVEPYALTARVIDRGMPDSLRVAGIPLAADTQQPGELHKDKLLLDVSFALENLDCSKNDWDWWDMGRVAIEAMRPYLHTSEQEVVTLSEKDRWYAMTLMLGSVSSYETASLRQRFEAALDALLERFELRRL